MKPAIFLDRDGVINQAIVIDGKPYPPADITQLSILPGVLDALNRLQLAGFLLIVITNQPDVARGTTSKETIEIMHDALMSSLPLDEIRACYHDNKDACVCRKPLPGALLSAAQTHQINLKESYMIGDRWRDIEAGQQAGCKTIFIDYGYREKQPESMDHCVKTLTEATHIILGECHAVK